MSRLALAGILAAGLLFCSLVAPQAAGADWTEFPDLVHAEPRPPTDPVAPLPPAVVHQAISIASLKVGSEPRGAAVDPTTGWVYVANAGSNNVSVVNGTSIVGSIPVGSFPYEVVFDGSNGYVYVVNQASQNVSVIRGTSVIGTVSVGAGAGGFSGQDGAVVNPVNGYVYVADWGTNNVSVINGTTLVASVPVGVGYGGPGGVVTDPVTGYVYVANTGSYSVSVINGTSVIAEVGLPSPPIAGAFDPVNGFVYVIGDGDNQYGSFNGTAYIFNGTSRVGQTDIGLSPFHLDVDPLQGTVYVTNSESNDVSVLDVQTPLNLSYSASSEAARVGAAPEGISFDPLNGYAFVANSGSNYVSVLAGASLVGSIPVGRGPVSTTFDPANGYVYVLNSGSANVSVLDGSFDYPILGSFSVVPSTVPLGSPTFFLVNGTTGGGSWTFAYSGLPANCTSSDSPVLTCTPSQAGMFQISVNASNSEGIYSTAVSLLTVLPGSGPLFAVRFDESGLPLAFSWYVELNGVWGTNASSSISFALPNGTYSFLIGTLSGYSASPASGQIVINGRDAAHLIEFSASLTPLSANFTYSIEYASCLPDGAVTNYVLLGADAAGGTAPYTYSWALPTGATTGPLADTTTIYGLNNTVTLTVVDSANHSDTKSARVSMQVAACPLPGPIGPQQSTPGRSLSVEEWTIIGLATALVAVSVAAFWLATRGRRGPAQNTSTAPRPQ